MTPYPQDTALIYTVEKISVITGKVRKPLHGFPDFNPVFLSNYTKIMPNGIGLVVTYLFPVFMALDLH